MSSAAELVARFLDLIDVPFTLPESRLMVFRQGDVVTVRTAEYERAHADCVVVDALEITDADGAPMPITRILADRVEFGASAVSLTFAGPNALSIGATRGGAWNVVIRAPAVVDSDGWAPDLPSAPMVRLLTDGAGEAVTVEQLDEHTLRATSRGPGSVCLAVGPRAGEWPVTGNHGEHLAATADTWSAWLARCPTVRDDLAPMAAFCWWVLGANTVRLMGHDDVPAVVPSKLGYVGLWQWDAYFIACGLCHGDPDLARQQIDLALRYVSDDGQLPDVVHDVLDEHAGRGVLASSDDLPPADLAALRRRAAGAADPDAATPLTKPPLTAWAIRKVLEVTDDRDWAREAFAVAGRSQQWWFDHADLDRDGLPEYSHPYNSGLDDSPIFDGALPVAAPDLAAYLVVQDDLLALHGDSLGDTADAQQRRTRSAHTLACLMDLWDPERGMFRARAGGAPLDVDTVVGLLPLLTGRLPVDVACRLRDALRDPERFAAPWGVPTVAREDPAFDPERMWRGPSWVNMAALLVDGLSASGFADDADALAEHTVQSVIGAGGPYEYVNPLTGRPPRSAVAAFSWSAALFIDLAVRLTP